MSITMPARPLRPGLNAVVVSVFLVFALTAIGQQPFDKAEFAARRAKVFEKIGDSVAIVFANEEHPHAVKYRETPDFFYLTGIEEPGAILMLDGKEKQAFIAAAKKPDWKVRSEGPGLRDIKDAADTYGVAVTPIENLYSAFNFRMSGAKKLYVPLSPPDQLQLGRGEVVMHDALDMGLPFARVSRVKNVIAGLHTWQPHLEFVDISPILDALRWVSLRTRSNGCVWLERSALKG